MAAHLNVSSACEPEGLRMLGELSDRAADFGMPLLARAVDVLPGEAVKE